MTNNTDSPAGIADDQIEELLRLEAEATPGPWKRIGVDGRRNIGIESADVVTMDRPDRLVSSVHVTAWKQGARNAIPTADLIVAMRNAIKPLIQRLKRAEAERDILRTRVVAQEAAWLERLMQSLEKESVKSIVEERDRLRSALKPFAELTPSFNGDLDGKGCRVVYESSMDMEFTVGDLRRAAAALADAGKGGGE